MQNTSSPKKALLGELESIIDILDDNEQLSEELFDMDKHTDELMDIPLLNDVVDEEPSNDSSSLFDLDRIFSDDDFGSNIEATEPKKLEPSPIYSKLDNSDEEQSEMFPVPNDSPEASEKRQVNLNQNLDLLIQELVDEFIPALENRLREQLSSLSPEIIQELAEKHLKP